MHKQVAGTPGPRPHLRRAAALIIAVAMAMPLAASSGTPVNAASPGKGAPLTPRLQMLADPGFEALPPQAQARKLSLPVSGPGSIMERPGGRILVDVRVSDTSPATIHRLRATGSSLVYVDERLRIVTVEVSPARLAALAAVQPEVLSVQEVLQPIVNAACPTGDFVSEGDAQLNVATGRTHYSVDGTGITVGIISDSYNHLGGAPGDVANGELPGATNPCGSTHSVVVQAEGTLSTDIDEGRAMAQIVHDLAPRADLRFATSHNGEQAFANQIRDLATAGAKVIVDDVSYFAEPMYQDGVIGKAVEDVTAQGVTYFSSAANSNTIVGGNNVASYEAQAFRPTTCPASVVTADPGVLDCHDFNPAAGVDSSYGITIDGSATYVLGWNEPQFGITTDLDLLVLNHSTGAVVAKSLYDSLVVQKAFESVAFSGSASFDVVVARYKGTATPRFKLISMGSDLTAVDYPMGSGGDVVGPTIFGHNASRSGATVAAIPYNNANTLETFSSRGPATYCWGPVDGTTPASPLPSCETATVDMSATDGVVNSFFGGGSPHRFYGTSAAAPHAAAVAALVLQHAPGLAPAQVLAAMQATAHPIGSFGTDAMGAGRLDADAAIGAATSPSNTAPTISNIPNQTTPMNTPEGPLAFTIGDAETAAASLVVSGSSSNTTLVPDANITFGGSGANRTVTVTPATGQIGTTTITVTVSDGDLTGQDTFVQTVTPTSTQCPPDDAFEPNNSRGAATPLTSGQAVAGVACDDDYFSIAAVAGQTITAHLAFTDADGDLDMKLQNPAGTQVASSTSVTDDEHIEYTVTQSGTYYVWVYPYGGEADQNSYGLTVTVPPPSNTAPTISNIPNQTTPMNTPEGPLAFTIGDAETAAASLVVSGSSSNTTLVPDANITFGGSGANRTVTVTPATGQIGTTTITVTVSDGDLTGQDTFVQTVTPIDTGVTASGVGVSYATFFPYKDGYRDTVAIRGTPGEPLSVVVKVYASSGKKVRTWTRATRTTAWSISWNGRSASGTRLPAGRYRVVQKLRDALGHTKTYTSYTTISNKRLYWSRHTITKYGNRFSMYGDPGSGSVSTAKSSYSRGVRLNSGTSWVAVRYSFTLRAAKIYEPLKFKVLGRSPNGRIAYEGLWNRTYGSSTYVSSYDRKTIGPGYRWYTIRGASSTHRSGRSTYGVVYVEYSDDVHKFDIAKVRLTYRYAVLR